MIHKPPRFTTSELWPSEPAHTKRTSSCMNSHEVAATLTGRPHSQFKISSAAKDRARARGGLQQQCPTVQQGCWRSSRVLSRASSDPAHPLAEHQRPRGEQKAAQPWLEKLCRGTGPASAPGVASPDGSPQPKPLEETFECFVWTTQLGTAARGCCFALWIEAPSALNSVLLGSVPLAPAGFTGQVFLSGEAETCLALSPPPP